MYRGCSGRELKIQKQYTTVIQLVATILARTAAVRSIKSAVGGAKQS